jgi:hypothetical protein
MPDVEVLVGVAFLVCIAVVARVTMRSWLSPGAFFSVIWSFIVILSLMAPVFGAPQYPVWGGAIWWINFQVFLLYVGDRLGQLGRAQQAPPDLADRTADSRSGLRYRTLIVAACTASTFIWMFSWDDIRGQGQEPPTALQLILAFHYAGALFGGLLFAASTDRRSKLLAILVLLPGLIFSLYGAGRTVVVSHFTFWFTGYFSMLLYLKAGRLRLFTPGRVAAALVCLAIFAAVGVLVKPFRSVERGISTRERVERYVKVLDERALDDSWEFMKPGFFGHVSALSWLLEDTWDNPNQRLLWGARTLNGFRRLLGISAVEDIRTSVGGVDTNVFTIFAPPIMDFGFVGASLIFFMVGIVSGRCYRQVVAGRLWPMTGLLMFYTNSMISGGWYFNYNSVTASYVIVGGYLFWVEGSKRKSANASNGELSAGVPATLAPAVRGVRRI